jgi:hypothetical protein
VYLCAAIPSYEEIVSTARAVTSVADLAKRWKVSGFKKRDTDNPALCRAPPAVGSVWLVPAIPLSE